MAGTAGAASKPSVTITPARALPGAPASLRGRGFPRSARIAVYFGGKRLLTIRANRRGRFRKRFRVPRRRAALHRILLRAHGIRAVRLGFRILVTKRTATATKPVPRPAATPAPAAAPPPSTKLVASGDIACEPPFSVTITACRHGGTSDRALALVPDAVMTLGDAQYEHGVLDDYVNSFGPSWGRLKAKTRPVIGNHEYLEDPQHDSAVGHFTYFGAAAGDPATGYYSFAIGQWQAFVLNSGDLGFNSGPDECFPVSCAAGSAQEQWLRTELAALPPDKCVVAAIHHPHHASDTARDHPDVLAPIYDALYDNGVELLLSGHSHTYERFQPMSDSTTVDSNFGVVQFVVGTGGKSLFGDPASIAPTSQKFDNDAFGVLELKLAAGRYDFRYLREDGTVFDSGGESCHRPHA